MSGKTNQTKTPVSLLQEFCVKKRQSAPIYTLIEDGTNQPTPDKTFVYEVLAFDYKAVGRGRNKNNAKHEAANNLIQILQNDDLYRDELSVQQPEVPRDACPEIDAVSVLMDICVDRNLPIAQFRIQQASGAAHAPEFVVECQVASIVRVGVFSSKKGAKQLAAKKVLAVLQDVSMNEELLQIAKNRSDEPPEKLFKRYYELKKEDNRVKSGVKICDRYLYFVNLSDEMKSKMREVLHDVNESDSEKVHLLCQAMNCKYNKSLVPDHPQRDVYCVEIFCEYDLCFANTEPEVYAEILDYVRVALSFEQRELHYQL
ncbi:uncharacterized protein LOC119069209 [Bradysia coprophila]|uniref:uncharacterized protein LOC119069209 n=1 Tax=Bradysia coprophila TaxID=38358 RepID=UPI00187D87CB|nr:uncharacterized protein LOC119069209 [Bradysia coprophila]XP_037029088.1 uncharacterized protein LOC119069209 [Bradysia coprophila]XP_037029097.1 uncharacterized protein LOC119069209 [Bradysia coprophila]